MKEIVKKIKKRENVFLCIGRGSLAGNYTYGEIRQYQQDRTGTLIPTKKGFTFPYSLLPELIEGLEELQNQLTE